MTPRGRKVLVGAAVGLGLFGLVAGRVLVAGRAALGAGLGAAARGEDEAALTQLRRATRWHLPGSPYPARAMDALCALADRAEARGDLRLARRALEAVRSGILATRSVYTPEAARLPPTNRRIATLLAREEGATADQGKTEAERAAYHLALLEHDPLPSLAWSLVALAGFATFVLGAVALTLRGVGPGDRLDRRAGLRFSIAIALGFACFVVGLWRA